MSDVLVRVSGSCGRITLNRPRALNALTLEMVNIMHTALMIWANDVSIQFVLVDGAGERGLCAGGDIRAMYNAVIADRRELATDFFRNEYRLNYLISRYPKPYVVPQPVGKRKYVDYGVREMSSASEHTVCSFRFRCSAEYRGRFL
jgi:enoyl-CoA hydratase/carnithine racemase